MARQQYPLQETIRVFRGSDVHIYKRIGRHVEKWKHIKIPAEGDIIGGETDMTEVFAVLLSSLARKARFEYPDDNVVNIFCTI